MKNRRYLSKFLLLMGILALGLLPTKLTADDTQPGSGASVQVMPDGSKIIKESDGTTIQMKADGTKLIKKPDGTTVLVNPDGSKMIKKPDGTSVEIKPGT